MLLFDSHVHSTFSPDGKDGLEVYARKIDEGTVTGIGFTEHYEFSPQSDALGYFSEETYLNEISLWRDRGYAFFGGVEADWMPMFAETMTQALRRFAFSHVIGSVHNLPSASISGKNVDWAQDSEQLIRVLQEYYDQVRSSLAVAEFDVIGHVGVYGRHIDASVWNRPRLKSLVNECEDALARDLACSDKILEVNTSGLFCERKATSAGTFLLRRFFELGGRRISLGSDAHRARDVAQGFGQAKFLLANLGFSEVVLPWDQKTPIRLDSLG